MSHLRSLIYARLWIGINRHGPRWFPGGPILARVSLKTLRGIYGAVDRCFPQRAPAELRRLVRGKRVCITGPSKGVLRNPPGLVESYDLVVRLNATWPVKPERQERIGRRCDILYHACCGNRDVADMVAAAEFASTKFVRLLPDPRQYKTLERATKVHSIPHAYFHHTKTARYLKTYDERPIRFMNTGFFAICELLDCDVAELYITGITFNCEDVYDYGRGRTCGRTRRAHTCLQNRPEGGFAQRPQPIIFLLIKNPDEPRDRTDVTTRVQTSSLSRECRQRGILPSPRAFVGARVQRPFTIQIGCSRSSRGFGPRTRGSASMRHLRTSFGSRRRSASNTILSMGQKTRETEPSIESAEVRLKG